MHLKAEHIFPIGALTSKPFAFVARPWELVTVPSADIYDSFMGSVRLDLRGTEILRILPLINENLNEEWVTDKVRFSYDGLKRQRVLQTYAADEFISQENLFFRIINFVSYKKLIKLSTSAKHHVLSGISKKVSENNSIYVTVGKETDFETGLLLDGMLRSVFKSVFYKLPDIDLTKVSSNFFRVNQEKILSSSHLLLAGTNPRWELPLLNLKLLRKIRDGNALAVYTVGIRPILNFEFLNLGVNTSKFFYALLAGRSKFLRKKFRFSKSTYLLLSSSYSFIANYFSKFKSSEQVDLPSFGIVTPWASNQGFLELLSGSGTATKSNPDFLLALGSDNAPVFNKSPISLGYFTHGTTNHRVFDILFPSPGYGEISAYYLNLFGYERYVRFATQLIGDVIPVWASVLKNFLNLRDNFYSRLTYSISSITVTYRNTISTPFEEDFAHLEHLNYSVCPSFCVFKRQNVKENITNYYRTHFVTRNSKPMMLASARFEIVKTNFL